MLFNGHFPWLMPLLYDGVRKSISRKKGQKRDCTATCTVLHLYQKLIERLNPKIQTKNQKFKIRKNQKLTS